MQITSLRKSAQDLFNLIIAEQPANSIFANATEPSDKYNLWRCSWAFDTLNDYFSLFPDDSYAREIYANKLYNEEEPSLKPLYKTVLANQLNAYGGAWWDDFGWTGIALIRFVNKAKKQHWNVEEEVMRDYIKVATNCYAYTNGPGWSNNPIGEQMVPFFLSDDDPYGWLKLEKSLSTRNIGAPAIWDKMPDKISSKGTTPITKPELKPGVENGLWNSAIASGCCPREPMDNPTTHPHDDRNLCGIQNTVTNGLHTVLSLRLLHLYYSDHFGARKIMDDAGINIDQLFEFWKNTLSWFNSWMIEERHGEYHKYNSMKMRVTPHGSEAIGYLIRERAPHYATGKYDSSYYPDLV